MPEDEPAGAQAQRIFINGPVTVVTNRVTVMPLVQPHRNSEARMKVRKGDDTVDGEEPGWAEVTGMNV